MSKSEAELREDRVRSEMDAIISEAITKAGHKREYVIYSAYDTDDDDCPINNLNDIAIHGKCVLVQQAEEFWGGDKARDYKSPVLENPTWLTVCAHANAMIKRVRDKHHVFLEDVVKLKNPTKDGIPRYRFSMGS